MSTPSPVRNASSNSDRADWDKAIGGSPSVRDLVVSHRRSRRWPPTSRSPAADPQTPPLHGTLLRGAQQRTTVRPNEPLDVDETKFFLTGNGYAPRVTVRDGRGKVVFTGPVLFLPLDANNSSEGVVKVPDAQPTQLAFEGLFLPTADVGPQGPYSMFPDALDPQLFLTAWTGDLGLEDGVPQSVFALDRDGLTQVQADGKPFAQALEVGETMTLPDGQGSLTFDGVSRFANFQIAYDPGKEVTLAAAIAILIGLTTSLIIRRRRIWVRISPTQSSGFLVETAGHSLTRRLPRHAEISNLVMALGGPTSPAAPADPADKDPHA
ncbi:cytochrome c biogenesis protein ResB [Pimelobacter simplex]|uniref:cytochrome c biogenesis protein ResB n=1 Tax=Nocardioides simplex TaxID=2045 RepID=UPI0021502156|nr:cytochrome c biogenesis protein ResB [Pimelobacter simplex]UUW88757.1 cytochrome c biogenesis protein ResB [Pimelobacter simplex]UUW98262.1 cytochrome c biogenesis protein ResB [Pimelobacter simplex]